MVWGLRGSDVHGATGVAVVDELKDVTPDSVVATQRQTRNVLVLSLAQYNIDRRLALASAGRKHGRPMAGAYDHTRRRTQTHSLAPAHKSPIHMPPVQPTSGLVPPAICLTSCC